MSSHHHTATCVIGAAVICATSILTTGTAHADEPGLAHECGLSAAAWASDSAVYTGSFYRSSDIVESVGWRTELVVRNEGTTGLTVSGTKTYKTFGNFEDTGADTNKDLIVAAALTRVSERTYHASTALQYQSANIELTLTPHCSADGNGDGDVAAVTGTLRYTDYGDVIRTANYTARPLLRGTPATGNDNDGAAHNPQAHPPRDIGTPRSPADQLHLVEG